MFGDFNLNGQWFAAMDSAHPHAFTFTEAVSFHIGCDTQDEIDLLWEHLAPSPDSGHCGWVNDQFGVAWQITPTAIGKWLSQGTPEQIQRTMTTMMAMKKLNIAHLESSR